MERKKRLFIALGMGKSLERRWPQYRPQSRTMIIIGRDWSIIDLSIGLRVFQADRTE